MAEQIAGVDAVKTVVWLDCLWMALAFLAILTAAAIALASALSMPVPDYASTVFVAAGTFAILPMVVAWIGRRAISGLEPVKP
jgi:hypothetical protein